MPKVTQSVRELRGGYLENILEKKTDFFPEVTGFSFNHLGKNLYCQEKRNVKDGDSCCVDYC